MYCSVSGKGGTPSYLRTAPNPALYAANVLCKRFPLTPLTKRRFTQLSSAADGMASWGSHTLTSPSPFASTPYWSQVLGMNWAIP